MRCRLLTVVSLSRLLGVNFLSTVRRARIQAFKILDVKSDPANLVDEDSHGNPTEVVPI